MYTACFLQGKGLMQTYWLVGKRGYDKPLPILDPEQDEQLSSLARRHTSEMINITY